jgi:hypothetical protein
VILFAGALEHMYRPAVTRGFARLSAPRRSLASSREGA